MPGEPGGNGEWVSFGGEESVLKLGCGDVCTTLWLYYKLLNCTLLSGEFTVGEIYLKKA